MKKLRGRIKNSRFGQWASERQGFVMFLVFMLGLVALLGAAALAPKGVPEKVEPIEQTRQIASYTMELPDRKPTEQEVEAGLLPSDTIPSTALLTIVKTASKLEAPVINPSTMTVVVAAVANGEEEMIYAAKVLPNQVDGFLEAFDDRNVDVTITSTASVSGATKASSSGESSGKPWWVTVLFFGGLFFLLLMFARWAMRQSAMGSESRKEAKRAAEKQEVAIPTTRFADVAGCDEAIEEMSELVEFFRNPERFTRTGARPSKGALLVGPPGTGKTLLARAVAGEAGVPFFSVAGSDFVEMYVGVGARRVRELFSKARKHEEGAIIFIDEIDAVGRTRSRNEVSGGSQETENTLNALLVEMDGFSESNIIVMGATNRDDLLDKALLRPGRLDRKVQVPLPDRAGRERILQVHAQNKPLTEDVDLNLIARRTPGMSGAELAQVVNEACMVAARADRPTVDASDFDAAVATIAMGKARTSAVVTEHDRLVTAWHEAGHTVSAMVLPDADPPVSVSIIPRGPAGGITWMAQGDDLFLTRRRAFARLVVAMSGRAAEEMLLDGEFTSGPHGDLQAATQTAMAMVTQYGMTAAGLMTRSEGLLATGANLTDDTVAAVEELLSQALEAARTTLRGQKSLLQAVVDGLLEHDTLIQAQLDALKEGARVVPPLVMPPAPKDYRKRAPKDDEPPAPVPVGSDRYRFPPEEGNSLVGRVGELFGRKRRTKSLGLNRLQRRRYRAR